MIGTTKNAVVKTRNWNGSKENAEESRLSYAKWKWPYSKKRLDDDERLRDTHRHHQPSVSVLTGMRSNVAGRRTESFVSNRGRLVDDDL